LTEAEARACAREATLRRTRLSRCGPAWVNASTAGAPKCATADCATDEKTRPMRYSPPVGGMYRIVTASATTLNPSREHAEAVGLRQLGGAKVMWEASFGLALWHSGDSAVPRRPPAPALDDRALLI